MLISSFVNHGHLSYDHVGNKHDEKIVVFHLSNRPFKRTPSSYYIPWFLPRNDW